MIARGKSLAKSGGAGNRLIIMVKEPRFGHVKTRLARDTGVVTAGVTFRINMRETVARLGADARWQTILAVAPDRAVASKMFDPRFARLPQGRGDLGERIEQLSRRAPLGPVVIIGADIPGIRPADIAAAFRALKSARAVFGPSGDGGYWLIGLDARARGGVNFRGVRWSTEHALKDSKAALRGLAIHHIKALDDIDRGSDLKRLRLLVGRRIVSAASACAPQGAA